MKKIWPDFMKQMRVSKINFKVITRIWSMKQQKLSNRTIHKLIIFTLICRDRIRIRGLNNNSSSNNSNQETCKLYLQQLLLNPKILTVPTHQSKIRWRNPFPLRLYLPNRIPHLWKNKNLKSSPKHLIVVVNPPTSTSTNQIRNYTNLNSNNKQ